MMNIVKKNYQKELETIIKNHQRKVEIEGKRPSLFLHSCCAPCSSYVLEYLNEIFDITVFFYNPNIYPEQEYQKRVEEIQRLIKEMPFNNEVKFVEGTYNPQCFFEMAKGLEQALEGGERCFKCYELRLRETARLAALGHFDYFTTTLTISPLKNAQKLNAIGFRVAEEVKDTSWLPSDFKKKNGYKRSIELSAEYHLYRQNFCGCVYSKATEMTNVVKNNEK